MYEANKIEEEVLQFWKDNNIYKKVRDKNKGNKPFYFLQGPPYTSGKLHMGHAWNNSLKDLVLRYKNMKGLHVWDRAGYDMHGIPTAAKVQEKLGLKTKESILKYGMGKFIKECMEFSKNHAKVMNDDLFRLGIWMDYKNAYMPIEEDWMESVWWLIKRAEEEGRLYEGKKTMTWCRNCGSALAKHECDYKEIKDKSIFVKFKVKNKENEHIIIWTTTPWTISFNLAVMVNPEIDYIRAKVGEEVWIIAKELADKVIKDKLDLDYSILEEFKGKELEKLEYEHPWNKDIKDFEILKKAHEAVHTVILSKEYVNLEAGTGLVHCAPGCGPEDYEVGRKYGIPPYNKIDQSGIFPEEFGEMADWIAKKDDQKFINKLEEDEVLLDTETVLHDYAHCERCKTPVIFRTTKQWFFKIEDLKEKMLESNKKVHWVPETVNNAFISWLENLRDNSITKQRFWGTPAPIWKCADCNGYTVIGSRKELEEYSGKSPENLHKPWIDEITLKCSCGGTRTRIPDVLDVWIDSGVASWACLYHPQKKELFEKMFPADLILEAREQVRGWFNLLMVSSMIATGQVPFKAVYSHGLLTGVDGVKMSKSLGNVISPYELIDKHGSDTTRLYLTQINAGEDISFSWEEAKIKQRTLSILWNLHTYLINYAKATGINPTEVKIDNLGAEEKFILSKLHRTIKKVTEHYEFYNIDKVPGLLEDLFLSLSRDYIQFTRDKILEKPELVLNTIYTVLMETTKMISTVTPFIAEKLYQNMKEAFNLTEESVHMFSWPEHDPTKINDLIENEMAIIDDLIQAGLSAREKAKTGVRWPLNGIVIVTKDQEVQRTLNSLSDLVKSKLNIKEIHVEKEFKETKVEVMVNNSAIGKDFKQDSPEVLKGITPEILEKLKQGDNAFVNNFELNSSHVIVKESLPEEFISSSFKQGYIVLDTHSTEELEKEGYSREVTRKIQDLRKTLNLERSQKINLAITGDIDVSTFADAISEKVGATSLVFEEKEYGEVIEFKIKDKYFKAFLEILK
ncbi:isoleucine--tRNA ligase [archaeon]|jgi:isoleucyl-tRNA synthetase|nr:isoleucine--tRNA ligase [archaeon]